MSWYMIVLALLPYLLIKMVARMENGKKKYKSSHWGGTLLVGVNIYHLGTTIYTWGANMYQKLSLGLYPFKN